jgi:transcriptional regulator with XRE-family HTH domain
VRAHQKLAKNDSAEIKSRFGMIVRTFRQRLGISQEELAWRASMHRTYLADVERGQRNISLTSIVRLVKALGVSLAVFFHAYQEYFQSPIETQPPLPTEVAPPSKPAKKSKVQRRSSRRPLPNVRARSTSTN